MNDIDLYIKMWHKKRKLLSDVGFWNEDDIIVYCPGAGVVFDYGLVCDIEPFKWKLPIMFKILWNGTQNDCLKLLSDCIDFEKRKIKTGGVSEQELKYIIYLKNIANYVIMHKFKAPDISRRKAIGGDYVSKTHFTI